LKLTFPVGIEAQVSSIGWIVGSGRSSSGGIKLAVVQPLVQLKTLAVAWVKEGKGTPYHPSTLTVLVGTKEILQSFRGVCCSMLDGKLKREFARGGGWIERGLSGRFVQRL
jgi:hypothetical protein